VCFEDLGVKLHFTTFDQFDILKVRNVSPSQIQPNSWASMRGFKVLCEGLGFQPSMDVYFTFYKTKGVDKRF